MNNVDTVIKYTVPNLRYRWEKELSEYSDMAIALCYKDFSFSDDYGNNDEKFPEWFPVIAQYEKEINND